MSAAAPNAERTRPARASARTGSRGCAARRSLTTTSAPSATAAANAPSVPGADQPFRGTLPMPYTSASSAAGRASAVVSSYGRSVRAPAAGGSPGISRSPSRSRAAATGAGKANVHRQLASVSRPDSSSPREKPLAPNRLYTETARSRAGPAGNVVVMIDSPVGAVSAAHTPLTTRVRIRNHRVVASAPASEAAAKTVTAAR